MGACKFAGPICQTKDWHQDVNDGTLARTASPNPSVAGSSTPAVPAKRPPRVVAKGKCAFLNPQSQGTVKAPEEAFDRLRRNSPAATISAPRQKASQVWPDKSTSPALELDVQIGTQKITVVRPTPDRTNGTNLPSVEQLAEALRAIPAEQRAATRTVTLSPTAAPGATRTGETIAGEAGDGEIILYPVKERQTQEDFDNRVTHESGHNYAQKVWDGPEGVSDWLAAVNADDRRPSPYAAGDGEDFPEFLVLYNTAKGTPCEATAKQIYPNRWKKMQSY